MHTFRQNFGSVAVVVQAGGILPIDRAVFFCGFFIDQPGGKQLLRASAELFPRFMGEILVIVHEVLAHLEEKLGATLR